MPARQKLDLIWRLAQMDCPWPPERLARQTEGTQRSGAYRVGSMRRQSHPDVRISVSPANLVEGFRHHLIGQRVWKTHDLAEHPRAEWRRSQLGDRGQCVANVAD